MVRASRASIDPVAAQEQFDTSFWESKRVLVTGGSGFLGRAVVALVRDLPISRIDAPGSTQANLTSREAVLRLFETARPNVVLHLAAHTGARATVRARPSLAYTSNLLMGTFVIEAARTSGAEVCVLVGTIASYPANAAVPYREETLWEGYPVADLAPYAIAKRALLTHALANHEQFGQQSAYILFPNLYGPGDRLHPERIRLVPKIVTVCLEAMRTGMTPMMTGNETSTLDLLYLEDAAEGVLRAAERGGAPLPLNLGSGRETSLRELSDVVADAVGSGPVSWENPDRTPQSRQVMAIERAQARLGFEPHTTLQDGIRQTVAAIRAQLGHEL